MSEDWATKTMGFMVSRETFDGHIHSLIYEVVENRQLKADEIKEIKELAGEVTKLVTSAEIEKALSRERARIYTIITVAASIAGAAGSFF